MVNDFSRQYFGVALYSRRYSFAYMRSSVPHNPTGLYLNRPVAITASNGATPNKVIPEPIRAIVVQLEIVPVIGAGGSAPTHPLDWLLIFPLRHSNQSRISPPIPAGIVKMVRVRQIRHDPRLERL